MDITDAINYLTSLSNQYIINNDCYLRQCKLCTATNKQNIVSKNHHSLLLTNFIPRWKANQKKLTHIVNYEFTPGIYQLYGRNGIGKTTFLKSISLPEHINTEHSKGFASLDGKPLFDMQKGLYLHRAQFKYISAATLQDSLNEVKPSRYKKYKFLYDFLKDATKANHKIQSEGEKGIISILSVGHQPQVKVLLIDEILSRIYQDKKYRLRDDIISFLKDKAQERHLIIIVVDHMTSIKETKFVTFVNKNNTYHLQEKAP